MRAWTNPCLSASPVRGSAVGILLTLLATPAAGQCTTDAAEIINVLFARILERYLDAHGTD